MPTNITQIDDSERDLIVLRVEGELMLDDALILEKIALGLKEEQEKDLALDFSDLDMLDSESAPIVRRLGNIHGLRLEGLHYFLQKMVEEAEGRTF